MRRRHLLGLIAAAAVAHRKTVCAQSLSLPRVGFLNSRSAGDAIHLVAGFRKGLGEIGYSEGNNVEIEYLWAGGQYERLPAMAADLVHRNFDVIVATGGEPAALAAKTATSTIPIVFIVGSDAVRMGLAASYSRPGGNLTGVNMLTSELGSKRLGLLRDLVPRAARIAFLYNGSFPTAAIQLGDMQRGARELGLTLDVYSATTPGEIDAAFDAMSERRPAALALAADPFFDTRRSQLLALAARQSLPAIYQFREYALAGGLASYGIDLADLYRQAGTYVGRILKGMPPGELPILQPTKFELVINVQTANALGLKIPPSILAVADEVID